MRVVEREPGALDRGDVVNGHAVQVLGAERVYEDPQSLGLDDHVVVQRALLHVEPVLEPGTAAGQNRHAEPGRLQRNLLLLDEPSLGLAPLLVHAIFQAIDEINQEGTTILLVEQNAYAALKHSHRAYLLETGKIVLEGPSVELAAHSSRGR